MLADGFYWVKLAVQTEWEVFRVTTKKYEGHQLVWQCGWEVPFAIDEFDWGPKIETPESLKPMMTE